MTDFRKLIVLDLDDTLWEGILGDDGWENLRALNKFQRALKDLKERGVLLALASKNDAEKAFEAIRRVPNMVLKSDDFVDWRINWDDKAKNVADIAAFLNLGLQSVVFIDDSPIERGRVREALPEVLVPDWPTDKAQYVDALDALDCFDTSKPTQEDLLRTQMYAKERERAKSRAPGSPLADWVATLGTKIIEEQLTMENLPRTAQLLNKSNQMNLATRRLTEQELWDWAGGQGHSIRTFKVSDRFGDAGLTGVLGLSRDDTTLHIVDFVLSCRVMGRLVEETMVASAQHVARRHKLLRVRAIYVPTAKNAPCLDFWANRSGFRRDGDTFTLELEET